MQALLARSDLTSENRVYVHFALGKALGVGVVEVRVKCEERSRAVFVACKRELRRRGEGPAAEGATGVLDERLLEENHLESRGPVAAYLPVNLARELELE